MHTHNNNSLVGRVPRRWLDWPGPEDSAPCAIENIKINGVKILFLYILDL